MGNHEDLYHEDLYSVNTPSRKGKGGMYQAADGLFVRIAPI